MKTNKDDKEFATDVFVAKHLVANISFFAPDKAAAESAAEESISFKIKEVKNKTNG